VLATIQILAILALTWIELQEPSPQKGLRQFVFSNAIGSDGARAALRLYRRRLDFLPFVGPGQELPKDIFLWARKAGFFLLLATQLLAFRTVLQKKSVSIGQWIAGPAISLIVLLIYPPINTDVFYYASVGYISNEGANPYINSPKSLGPNLFDRYSDWEHITAPYGPLWTGISRVIVALTGNSPFYSSVVFKLFDGACALLLALMAAKLAFRLTGSETLKVATFIIVAWCPIVLYETAGTAHLDPLLMLLALSGLHVMTSERKGGIRTGILLIGASAMCKPVTIPLLALASLVRFTRRTDPIKTVIKKCALDVFAVLALVAVMYAPYWDGGKLPRYLFDNSRNLYVDRPLRANPFWIWFMPRLGIGGGWIPLSGAKVAQIFAVIFILITMGWLFRRAMQLRKDSATGVAEPLTILRWQIGCWAIVMFSLSYVPPNAHSWYMIWAIPLVALVTVDRIRIVPEGEGSRFLPNVVWSSKSTRIVLFLFYFWSFASFYIYHNFYR
jgi:hypothetical protein